jgi:hypothetical protein
VRREEVVEDRGRDHQHQQGEADPKRLMKVKNFRRCRTFQAILR